MVDSQNRRQLIAQHKGGGGHAEAGWFAVFRRLLIHFSLPQIPCSIIGHSYFELFQMQNMRLLFCIK
ncbi:hypothetical protein Nepgr_011539 [Nepenthes gracilis]|uniref:Uncharacterized protein n=1 Tax=Nepenthes gracilis TaxID=150966 RepID=A0AAD3SEJ5_NEPGR|nr:hypothetical protein Nepgr_011539 [Nepenthes gracilis]